MRKKESNILIGCVADDFTGAGDAASFLAEKGIKTMLFNGIPGEEELAMDCRAVVIALKTRSARPEIAAAQTLTAFHWLEMHGARQFYVKYCSTFDSSPEGNIGPVVDCILEAYGVKYTVLCPSLPVNKRTVRSGQLFVDGVPLDESPMRNHPLNPMWDSHIERLMKEQGKYSALVIDGELLTRPKEEILNYIEEYGQDKDHFYVIPDFETDAQGNKIAEVFGDLKLLTGGSGLLAHIAEKYAPQAQKEMKETAGAGTVGKGLVLSGSCSKATREQIRYFKEKGGRSLALFPEKLLSGEMSLEVIWQFIQENMQGEVLIYCDGYERKETRTRAEQERNANVLEKALADIAVRAYHNGYNRIIAAGGETSGAIALALGFDVFLIGKSIAPGVPVMIPLRRPEVRLVLKSGNFGQPDFFVRALDMTGGR